MSALGSSVINKSSKKFAPKPQARRHGAGSTPAVPAPSKQTAQSHTSPHASPHAPEVLPTEVSSLQSVSARLQSDSQDDVGGVPGEEDAPSIGASQPPPRASVVSNSSQASDNGARIEGRSPNVTQVSTVRALPQASHTDMRASSTTLHTAQQYSHEGTDPPASKRRKLDVRSNISVSRSRNAHHDPDVALPSTETDLPSRTTTCLGPSQEGVKRTNRRNSAMTEVGAPSVASATSDVRSRPVSTGQEPVAGHHRNSTGSQARDRGNHPGEPDQVAKRAKTSRKPATAKSKKQKIQDAAAEIVEDAAQGGSKNPKIRAKRSKKAVTPEDAEHHTIDANEVRMTDLTVDTGTGQKSHREAELRELDRAAFVKKKQRELQQVIGDAGSTPQTDNGDIRREHSAQRRGRDEDIALNVPNVVIINGQIRIDESSLRIDRHAAAEKERENEPQLEGLEESELTRKINSGTYMRRDKSGGWNELLLERFYDGLRMFGTDFGMISKMFPGKSRHSVKLKFTKEERDNPGRIKKTLLGEHMPIDLDEYQKWTGEEYGDPAILEQEMEDDKRHLEEEVEAEKTAIEAARVERIEQAEVARREAGDDSSSKENRRRKKKRDRGGKKEARRDSDSAPRANARRRSGGMLEGVGEKVSERARRAREINMG